MLKILIVTLLKVLFVSFITSLSIFLITSSISISIGVFILALILQFWAGYLISVGRERRDELIFNESILKEIKNAKEHRTSIQLSCAYCQTINTYPVSLEFNNVFKCISCGQPNNVHIQLSTIRVTHPLSETIPVSDINLEDEADIAQTTINDNIGAS